jgi:hypothetical protein
MLVVMMRELQKSDASIESDVRHSVRHTGLELALVVQKKKDALIFLVLSTADGLLGKEAKIILLQKLSAFVAEKWEKPYSYSSVRSLRICQCSHEHCHIYSLQREPPISVCGSRIAIYVQNEQTPPAVSGRTSKKAGLPSTCLFRH